MLYKVPNIIISIETIEVIIFDIFLFSCNVECQDTCATSSWTEWSTCKPRHCNENYREEDRVEIGYQKPSIPGKQNVSQLEKNSF